MSSSEVPPEVIDAATHLKDKHHLTAEQLITPNALPVQVLIQYLNYMSMRWEELTRCANMLLLLSLIHI